MQLHLIRTQKNYAFGENNMSTCILPGKFEPLHNGHLLVVKGMTKICDRVIVAVCHSADSERGELFSKEQIQEMISEALMSERLMDVEIKFVPNCQTDDEWGDRIIELADGDELTIWSGRNEVISLFTFLGVKTKPIVHVPGHESDVILEAILAGNDSEWRSKVPESIIKTIENSIK
jgi:nicotinamide-nucleotide adenylyltransferase